MAGFGGFSHLNPHDLRGCGRADVVSAAMLKQPSVPIFVALACGILCADLVPVPLWLGWLVTFAGFCTLILTLRRRRGTFLVALGLLGVLGAWRAIVASTPPAAIVAAPEGGLWRVRVDAPISRQVDARGVHQITYAQLLAEHSGTSWLPRQGRARLRLRPGQTVVRGDVLELRLQVRPMTLPRNPTDPQPHQLQRRLQIGNVARVRSEHALVQAGGGWAPWIDGARRRASEVMEQQLDPEVAGLAKALALGDQAAIAPLQREAWADAGVAHLLSVSGLHISLVALVLAWVLRAGAGWLPGAGERFSTPRLAALCALPGVVGYCVLTGMSPPAVRSAVMTGAALVGLVWGRPSAVGNAWGVAGCLMLLVDPWALYDPGFLLSFAAVAALVWWAPRPPKIAGFWPKLRQGLWQGLAVSAAASLVTAPITAHFFGRVSWAAPLVNLLAVPVGSALATPLALGFALLAPSAPGVARLLGVPLGWTLGFVDGLSRWVSSLGWASVDMPPPSALQWGLYALLLGCLLRQGRRARWTGRAAGLALGITALWPQPANSDLRVHQIYVGQGDATLIQLPQGGTVLVDGGGGVLEGDPDPGQQAVAPWLRKLGVRHLDLLILSHPHPDHLNGLLYVTQRWPVRELWWNGAGAEVPAWKLVRAAVEAHGGVVHAAAELPASLQRQGVTLQILHPRGPDNGPYPQWHHNDNSLVVRLQYGARSMLLAGDIERPAEALLAAHLPPTDILKVPHHGSRTSSSWPLLLAMQPWAAGISCGEDNRFDFPHPEVSARYAAARIPLYRTDLHGMLSWRTDGRSWWVTSARAGPLDRPVSRSQPPNL